MPEPSKERIRFDMKITQKNTLLKIVVSLLTVSFLVTLSLSIYFYQMDVQDSNTFTAQNVIKLQDQVDSLQTQVSNLQSTVSQDSASISSLQSSVTTISNENTNLQQSLNSEKASNANLSLRLAYAVIVISGTAHTNPGNPTVAVEFSSSGIVTKAAVQGNNYVAMLANFRSYSVVVDYTTIGIALNSCTPTNHSFTLDLVTTTMATADYSC